MIPRTTASPSAYYALGAAESHWTTQSRPTFASTSSRPGRQDLDDWQRFSTGEQCRQHPRRHGLPGTEGLAAGRVRRRRGGRPAMRLTSARQARQVSDAQPEPPLEPPEVRQKLPLSGRLEAERPRRRAGRRGCPPAPRAAARSPPCAARSPPGRTAGPGTPRVGDGSVPPRWTRHGAPTVARIDNRSGQADHVLGLTSDDPGGGVEHSPPLPVTRRTPVVARHEGVW